MEDKDYQDYLSKIEKSLTKNNEVQNNTEREIRPSYNRQISRHAKKRRRLNYKALFILAAVIVLIVALILSLGAMLKSCGKNDKPQATEILEVKEKVKADKPKEESLFPDFKNSKSITDSDITSKSVIFIDDGENKVIASRKARKRMYPASLTKVMTLLVAVENIDDYSGTFTMTYQITDPLYKEGATVAGFSSGEVINMYDLLYGISLPSGADAAMAMAEIIAGSEQEFVALMNKKADELKLKDTHFTNCTGLFDQNHYSTAEDLSVILRTAMRNELCRKILSTYKYTTSKTEQHPNGIELENTLFKYMYGSEPEGADILGGKTGYVAESGYCIASFGKGENGKTYVCVTLFGASRWPGVFDQINLYTKYSK